MNKRQIKYPKHGPFTSKRIAALRKFIDEVGADLEPGAVEAIAGECLDEIQRIQREIFGIFVPRKKERQTRLFGL